MKIIFFDIDGTLALGKEVPESAKLAIRLLRQNGNLVWICTGRGIQYVKRNFHQYANGYICSNGREGYTCCEKIFEKPLTETQINTIQQKLNQLNAGYAFFDTKHGYYYGPEEGFERMSEPWDEGFMIHGGDLSNKKFYNFDLYFKDKQHLQIIQEELKDIAILNPHLPHPTADVSMIGWNKGDALKAVCEYFNLAIEDTYAFGDGKNDLTMLQASGHGIAMGNACEELKEIADYVTTDINEDGIYNGLKHYHLI